MFKKEKKHKENYNYIEVESNPDSQVSHAMQKFVVNIEFLNVDKKYQALQITSTLPSEGKTTLVGNLAYLLTQKGYKTIIIDLDLRKPKVNRIFEKPNIDGLNKYLIENAKKEDIIVKTSRGVDFIPTGQISGSVSAILESEKLSTLIEELKKDYDYILLDTPPMQVNADALMASKLACGVLYVVAQNLIKKSLIKESIKTLKRRSIPIVGIVLTQVKAPKREGYYYYYYTKDND
ncbi:MAG: CpsD/CapB family tyrosine-protein kinase [Acholeplasmataceae bacterium]|jgi:capsular exopolysaccharide synthesis family protein|nr:CpsD/CapB family tyrosine-protein kinase [Acholeplasmataceae bacterium]